MKPALRERHRNKRPGRKRPCLESLEERRLLAVMSQHSMERSNLSVAAELSTDALRGSDDADRYGSREYETQRDRGNAMHERKAAYGNNRPHLSGSRIERIAFKATLASGTTSATLIVAGPPLTHTVVTKIAIFVQSRPPAPPEPVFDPVAIAISNNKARVVERLSQETTHFASSERPTAQSDYVEPTSPLMAEGEPEFDIYPEPVYDALDPVSPNRQEPIGFTIRRDYATVVETLPHQDTFDSFGGLIELAPTPLMTTEDNARSTPPNPEDVSPAPVVPLESGSYDSSAQSNDESSARPREDRYSLKSLGFLELLDGPWLGSASDADDVITESLGRDDASDQELEEGDEAIEGDASIDNADEVFAEEWTGEDWTSEWDVQEAIEGMIAMEATPEVIQGEAASQILLDETALADVELELEAAIGRAVVLELMDDPPETDSDLPDPVRETPAVVDPNTSDPVTTVDATTAGLSALIFFLHRPTKHDKPRRRRPQVSRFFRKNR